MTILSMTYCELSVENENQRAFTIRKTNIAPSDAASLRCMLMPAWSKSNLTSSASPTLGSG